MWQTSISGCHVTSIQQKETVILPAPTEPSPSEVSCILNAMSSPNSPCDGEVETFGGS